MYLKTGDQCDYQRVQGAGYGCFLRRDFLEILNIGVNLGVKNDIFTDFHRHLIDTAESVDGFLTIPPKDWENPQWKGFFIALKDEFSDGDWDFRGHTGGAPITFRWHEDKTKGTYLGLDGEGLYFKIHEEDELKWEAKWQEWNRKFTGMAPTAGLPIKVRKSHRKLGKRMTLAILEGDYRQVDADGLLDLVRTFETLRKAEALMDAVAT